MDKLNLNLYVEQVNHEADNTTTVDKWDENEEELALSNVVDANTEFKSRRSGRDTTPSNSYGLPGDSQILEQRKLTPKPQLEKKHVLAKELIQLQAECVHKELEETLEGSKNWRKRSTSDSSLVPQVHMYTSSNLFTQEAGSFKDMDNLEVALSDSKTKLDSLNKLLKYPSDRITVVTERCSYLTKSSNNTKDTDSNHLQKNIASCTIRDKMHVMAAQDSPLSIASSQESRTIASMVSNDLSKSSLISTHSFCNLTSEASCGLDRSTTTADQLAWEFRRARDRLDTASNISGCSSRFELDSNFSERAETMSTISDVSGYEEEMFRIKRLLLLDSVMTPTPPPGKHENRSENTTPIILNSDVLRSPNQSMEIQIHKLSLELQSALAEKEKYKMEATAVENKIVSVWQEKYQEALRQKAHMEGQLETVQTEMAVLVSEKKEILEHTRKIEQELKLRDAAGGKTALHEMEKLVLEINRLQQIVRESDTKNRDLTIQLELRDSEINQLKIEVEAADSTNEKLRIELQELKVEAESKDGAIQGLKNKISDQHVEFQSLLQAKLKAENKLISLKNEVDSTRKSGNWYRDQLHACQAAKVKVQQELMASQGSVVSQSHHIEKLKGEIAHLNQLVEETQHRAVREKEMLMRKLEVIQADMLEREATIFTQIHKESNTETINSIAVKLKKMEEERNQMINVSDTDVQELKEEIVSLKKELQTKETLLETSCSENGHLMMRTTVLQKTLNEKELALQLLENKYKNIEMSHNHLTENLKTKEQALLELKNEKVAIEVALAAAGREKTEVDSAINKLREDFTRITGSYQTMKAELREKEKHIRNLMAGVTELQKEKKHQMEKIHELQRIEDQHRELQGRMSQTENLEKEVEKISKVNRELSAKISELNESYNYAKEQISKMEETVAAREEQLMNQTRNIEVHGEELNAKEQSLTELQNEKTAQEGHVKKLQLMMTEQAATNSTLTDEVASLKMQLTRANGAIEQFNLLCRKSEEEKNCIEKEMKKMTKELEIAKTSHSANVNGSVLTPDSQNDGSSPLEITQKSTFLCENGRVQTNLHHLYNMLQKTESTVLSLLSDSLVNQEKQMQNEQSIRKLSNSIDGFDAVLSLLVKISDSLCKAQDWKNKVVKEIQLEKHLNESLKNELSRLKSVVEEKSLPGKQKVCNISYGTQTYEEDIKNYSTQNWNNNDLKNKEQIEQYQKEINKLKGSLKICEIEHREKHRKYESNVRTLLKKVKEHMRGRKVAERSLEELRGRNEEGSGLASMRNEVSRLQLQLEASQKKNEEQKILAERNQEALLLLEKEKGKLAQSCSISKDKFPVAQSVKEDVGVNVVNEFDQKTRELQLRQSQSRIAELEEEVRKSHIIIKELRKEIFSEKCETSQLRKQLSSLRVGLDTANDMLDTKKVELGRTESLCCVLRTNVSHLKKQLEMEQQAHEECKQEVEKLGETLEETRAKDPVLADQIKTLSYHLHQKAQEAAGLQEKILLSEERWLATENGLQRSMSALQDELAILRTELDSVRDDKFTLQTQAAELRTALHSSIEQNKVLRLKLETFGCETKDKLPDLTSSLPLPPIKYDETRIAELLHQSTVLPHNKPLNNLQCCLNSLKQEMATLQKQLVAKTSGREQIEGEIKRDSEHSSIKDV